MLARRVLVTGGSGFIGTHLVSAVLDDGADLLNLDVKRPVLPDQRKHWRDLDLLDAKAVEQAVVEPPSRRHLSGGCGRYLADWRRSPCQHPRAAELDCCEQRAAVVSSPAARFDSACGESRVYAAGCA